MNHKLATLLVLILLIGACGGTRNIPSPLKESKELQLGAKDSLRIIVDAIDLSEDMSRLSTKNDELLILIYELQDSLILDQFLFSKELKLDEKNRSKTTWFSTNKNLTKSKLLFLLIEQDSETPIEQIDPIVRIHYQQIIKAFESGNYIEIEKFLGDEDVLGIKTISKLSNRTSIKFRFSGIHKLDKFEYVIRLGN